MSLNNEEIYTIKDIADKLKVCVNTVRTLVKSGRLPAIKVGRQWRITSTDLQDYLEEKKNRNGHHNAAIPQKVVPLTGPKHASQGIFGDDSDHDDLFA